MIFVIFAFCAWHLLILMHIFQQEEYNNTRFLKTLFSLRFGVKRLLKNPLKDAKKPLVMTYRAKRIYVIALALVFVFLMLLHKFIFGMLLAVVFQPAYIVLSNIILSPYEAYVKRKFWRQAHEKLLELSPIVVGVTGSFGKTSIKHILGHILSKNAPTLITSGSINTQMGIARTIRQNLESRHKYFIVEMGAYGVGSIAGICKLTPPDYGVVTNVGAAHLERFGNLETTALAKSELVLACKNNSVIPSNLLKYNAFKKLAVKCVIPKGHKTKQTKKGIVVTSEDGEFFVPIFGIHHGDNVALAIALAKELGLDVASIKSALETCPQIEHRLFVTKYKTEAILIDDAYNANPIGMMSGVDLLDFLSDSGEKRRILVTPGVVELGDSHCSEHTKLGKYAAKKTDIVLAVCAFRIPTFVDGYNGAGEGEILTMEKFSQAQAWLNENTGKDDVILIANDLPDIYEI